MKLAALVWVQKCSSSISSIVKLAGNVGESTVGRDGGIVDDSGLGAGEYLSDEKV